MPKKVHQQVKVLQNLHDFLETLEKKNAQINARRRASWWFQAILKNMRQVKLDHCPT